MEQKRKKEEEDRLKKIEEEKNERQALFMSNLEQFLSGDSFDPPAELLSSRHTRPATEPCPFFTKTACCRFGDQCSRNHEYPGISKVINYSKPKHNCVLGILVRRDNIVAQMHASQMLGALFWYLRP